MQHATINNLAFGRNVTETLRILQAIQYVQENPDEVWDYQIFPGSCTSARHAVGNRSRWHMASACSASDVPFT